MSLQLEFFKDFNTVRLEDEIRKQKESNERVRKKLFAENGKLKKELTELQERMAILERNICSGEIICQWNLKAM